ncbi:MAG TPA: hypothetical protein VKB56_10670, partial [Terriglobales bacterium]|nr:hypothetical protein [Terriglobales bacterium]
MNLRFVFALFLSAAVCANASAANRSAKSASAAAPAPATSAVLLDSMQHELNRAMSSLAKADPAPYFISYS